ncbi:hypothetical protein [Pandoraea commovens]|uniref:Uncharacterized protein n=1 Tax=Pandoraea commovens TaxID=2508289 RepID=A0ABY5QI14_9BURK|nr:hypothetical protein [Pandoraea commovens]UVA80447.1 hypothetical protein NTU39_05330 [Pandoraea commovens]
MKTKPTNKVGLGRDRAPTTTTQVRPIHGTPHTRYIVRAGDAIVLDTISAPSTYDCECAARVSILADKASAAIGRRRPRVLNGAARAARGAA